MQKTATSEGKMEIRMEQNRKAIHLQGTVGENDYINARGFRNIYDSIPEGQVDIHINSRGGDPFEAFTIYNHIKQSGRKVHMYIDGMAASAASIIAMAGTKVFMPENTMLMIHNAHTIAAGNASYFKKLANRLDQLDDMALNTYMSRFTGTREELATLRDNETWFTAEQCLALGFCDEIVNLKEEVEPENQANEILNKYVPGFNPENHSKATEEAKTMQMQFRASLIENFLSKLEKQEEK